MLMLVTLLVACSSTKNVVPSVPKEVDNTNSKVDKKDSANKIDSIYVHDSIFVFQKGDTIYKYVEKVKARNLIKYKYITVTDSFCKVDSIPYAVTVEKTVVTNELYWWQKALMAVGAFSLVAGTGYIIYKAKKICI